jgi:hypothetical protein
VNAEPVIIGEEKEHLFAAGDGAKKPLPNETASELISIGVAEDPFLAM